ncbi:EAL and modified HD-GYP domain-containing signal transduction protein [Motilibacter peucedani]|uniref:EAL and modified HD-GYP domain-containing signal transduction protein n=1 Tax=Motilibacter peucedani TaxID=598650 RepID=A0A420XSC4_9ACTN|nr:HDOD domain-containing protein [Motilibacter peucedani]RKS77697.1 EAL and modified HD-GYP domain-containing signal transduction protein [Motilibacter peucedani]
MAQKSARAATSETATGVPVHVGRQGIYDADGTLQAYELLFRSATDASAAQVATADADRATTAVIVAAFADFDASLLLGGRRGFVNLSRAFAVGELPVPFSPDVAVLEILESLVVDDELLAGVERLKAAGYRIALDDFVLCAETEPLLPFADYVKVDVLETTWDEVVRVAGVSAGHGAVLLAEKIEDAAMLERCRALGFELFQGYHLGRPQTMTTQTLAPAQLAAVQLLAALADPAVEFDAVERLVAQDPALTWKLLRVANSAGSAANRSIGSLREAMVRVGLAQLRAWVMLLSVSTVAAGSGGSDIEAVTARARACQLLADRVPRASPDTAFTLGILEGVAGLLGMSGADLLTQIPLEGSLADGLRGEPTPERAVLEVVLGHERHDLGAARSHGIDVGELSSAYLSSLRWSHESLRSAE